MYRRLVNLSKVIRWLSLDIALGGAILISFVSRSIYNLSVPAEVVAVLMVAILLIYTVDHLLDATRIEQPTMKRHQFHKKYQKQFTVYLLVLGVIGITLLFFLPSQLMLGGCLVAISCGIYLLVSYYLSRKGAKELVVAVIYASAMFLYPSLFIRIGPMDFLLFFQLFFLAYGNLLIISFFEYKEDFEDETSSVAHVVGSKRTMRLTVFLIISNVLTALVLWCYSVAVPFQIFILLASLTYSLIIVFQKTFRADERYRWASDLVFLLPILFI